MSMFNKQRPECEKLYCMANINGRCSHYICPMKNPDYVNPSKVADEIEEIMIAQLLAENKD